jgi:hypothetical protein
VHSLEGLKEHYELSHADLMPQLDVSASKGDEDDNEEVMLNKKENQGETEEEETEMMHDNDIKAAGMMETAKTFRCVVCKKKFSEKPDMKVHVRKVHLARVVPCKQCGASVKEQEMEQHRVKYHN